MAKNDWKKREGVVYSTDSNFKYNDQSLNELTTLPANQQQLRVELSKNGRAGKQVTLIKGFVGNSSDIELLTKELKKKCGVGGATKDGEILIQGDVRARVTEILQQLGYKAKRIN